MKRSMILYHFTDFYYLKNGGTILKEGLKPHCDEELPFPLDVVWFTTEANPVWWWENGKKSECRVTVVIPATDKRLVRFGKLMKKNFPQKVIKNWRKSALAGVWSSAMKSWYVYFGDVPLTKLQAIEYADSKRRAEVQLGAITNHGKRC
jgi:hypothetical protein